MSSGKEEKVVPVQHGSRGWLMPWPKDLDGILDWPLRGARPWPRLWRDAGWLPDIDVFEQEGNLVVRADIPGMKPEDIYVAVEGDILMVRGQRKEEREVKKENYYLSERSEGDFSRSIRLPEGADAENIQATYKNGVLEVTVPITHVHKAKKVEVEVK